MLGIATAAVLVSCGREAAAPLGNGVTLVRHGLFSVEPVFPRLVSGKPLSSVVAFDRVRLLLRRTDGNVALDTTVRFPADADSVSLSATVSLSPSAGSGGEHFTLEIFYLTVIGQVVFSGGPVDVVIVPDGSGIASLPAVIPVNYTGPGSTATKVAISPRSVSVTENRPFEFSAIATDASGAVWSNAPIVWSSLDPLSATLNSISSGAGASLAVRGVARIVAQLLTGPADTALVTVTLAPKAMALVSGAGQTGVVGATLAQPLVVRVVASDGVGVAGVNVAFDVASGLVKIDLVRTTRAASGLDVEITGFDTSHSASRLAFRFIDRDGAAVAPGEIAVDAAGAFRSFFDTSAFGGLFKVHAVFPVTGNALQITAIEVDMTNTVGTTMFPRTAIP